MSPYDPRRPSGSSNSVRIQDLEFPTHRFRFSSVLGVFQSLVVSVTQGLLSRPQSSSLAVPDPVGPPSPGSEFRVLLPRVISALPTGPTFTDSLVSALSPL